MPYPNEHSLRIRTPRDFDPDTFRRTKGGTIYGRIKVPKTIGVIWGKLKGKAKPSDPPLVQALRFPISDWEKDDTKAKKWIADNLENIKYEKFEPAEPKKKQEEDPEAFQWLINPDEFLDGFEESSTDIDENSEGEESAVEVKNPDIFASGFYPEPVEGGFFPSGTFFFKSPNVIFCPSCGWMEKYSKDHQEFCPECGKNLKEGLAIDIQGVLHYGEDVDIYSKTKPFAPGKYAEGKSPFYCVSGGVSEDDIYILPLERFDIETDDDASGKSGNESDEIATFALETRELTGRPIFEAGTHNGDPYTIEDLDQMVANFDKLKETVKPPLKLGHDKQEGFLESNMPAVGWIKRIWREGKQLLADICDIPKKIADVIEAGAYRRFSAEIYLNYKHGKEQFGKVLAATSLLGAKIPAVKTLPDVLDLYNSNNEGNETKVYFFDSLNRADDKDNEEVDEMAIDAAALKKMEEELANYKTQMEEAQTALQEKDSLLEAEKTKVEDVTKVNIQLLRDRRSEEIRTFVETAKAAGKVLPAFEQKLTLLADSLDTGKTIKFSEADKDGKIASREVSQLDLLKEVVSSLPKLVDFGETTGSGGDEEPKTALSEQAAKKQFHVDEEHNEVISDLDLHTAAEKLASEQKIPYTDALLKVYESQAEK